MNEDDGPHLELDTDPIASRKTGSWISSDTDIPPESSAHKRLDIRKQKRHRSRWSLGHAGQASRAAR
ncbi:MAG: hypothetical protein ACI8Y4_003994 [Candidatus Poriferisodalaceae bacterium]|jgi:hypothetical protein